MLLRYLEKRNILMYAVLISLLPQVWDLEDFGLVERLRDHTGEVNSVVISGDTLYSASFDKSIKVLIAAVYVTYQLTNY